MYSRPFVINIHTKIDDLHTVLRLYTCLLFIFCFQLHMLPKEHYAEGAAIWHNLYKEAFGRSHISNMSGTSAAAEADKLRKKYVDTYYSKIDSDMKAKEE